MRQRCRGGACPRPWFPIPIPPGFGNTGGHKALPYMIAAGLAIVLLFSACATGRDAYRERGRASWYGEKFHGRQTASGETYDMYAMTAAHKTLPFGTMVEVRNRDNGRSTVVRINDRGPFKRGRIIDLSYSAAEEIGMVGPGTARVEIRVAKRGQPLDDRRYTIQVGSFRERSGARELSRDPAFAHLGTTVERQGPFFRVLVGNFKRRAKALDAARGLERQGFSTFVRAR